MASCLIWFGNSCIRVKYVASILTKLHGVFGHTSEVFTVSPVKMCKFKLFVQVSSAVM